MKLLICWLLGHQIEKVIFREKVVYWKEEECQRCESVFEKKKITIILPSGMGTTYAN